MVKIHNIRKTKLVHISWLTNPYQAGLIRGEELNDFQLPFYIILSTFNVQIIRKSGLNQYYIHSHVPSAYFPGKCERSH